MGVSLLNFQNPIRVLDPLRLSNIFTTLANSSSSTAVDYPRGAIMYHVGLIDLIIVDSPLLSYLVIDIEGAGALRILFFTER